MNNCACGNLKLTMAAQFIKRQRHELSCKGVPQGRVGGEFCIPSYCRAATAMRLASPCFQWPLTASRDTGAAVSAKRAGCEKKLKSRECKCMTLFALSMSRARALAKARLRMRRPSYLAYWRGLVLRVDRNLVNCCTLANSRGTIKQTYNMQTRARFPS